MPEQDTAPDPSGGPGSTQMADHRHCHFCNKPVTEENYCYGCETHVCDACDHRNPEAMGSHSVEDHEGDEGADAD